MQTCGVERHSIIVVASPPKQGMFLSAKARQAHLLGTSENGEIGTTRLLYSTVGCNMISPGLIRAFLSGRV